MVINLQEMAENKIWLSTPHMGGNEQRYLRGFFDSNWIGAKLRFSKENLERGLFRFRACCSLNSGTAAIHLGLILLGG
jgi:dTDP-4-amino-4,6-dideoxygalactose transaminase